MLKHLTPFCLVPALALATGCTVDSNARVTLGGGGDARHEDEQVVMLPALGEPGVSKIAQDSAPIVGVDRSAWSIAEVLVPAFEVRHGTFAAIHTDLAPDRPRWDARVPTPESALDYERGDPWRQIAEVPQSYGAMVVDLGIAVVRFVKHGPGSWHASPRWEGERSFAGGQQ